MIDNLSLYKYFYETARAGSISSAAKKLYVSQPAVSSMIGNLEKELNTVLFFRTSRGITLTPEGALLFDFVKSAFSFLEAGENKLQEISNLSGGLLRIGASDMTLRFFLLKYIRQFNTAYPGVHLTVTNAPTPQTLEALKCGKIDLCVVSGPIAEDDALITIPVKTVEDIFVANADFFPPRSALTFEELSEYPLIMLEKDTSTRRYTDKQMRAFCEADRLPQPKIELATSDLVLEFAKQGIGIGCIVRDFAEDALKRGELYPLSLAHPFLPRSFYLTYLKNISLSSAAAHFVSSIKDELSVV